MTEITSNPKQRKNGIEMSKKNPVAMTQTIAKGIKKGSYVSFKEWPYEFRERGHIIYIIKSGYLRGFLLIHGDFGLSTFHPESIRVLKQVKYTGTFL